MVETYQISKEMANCVIMGSHKSTFCFSIFVRDVDASDGHAKDLDEGCQTCPVLPFPLAHGSPRGAGNLELETAK